MYRHNQEPLEFKKFDLPCGVRLHRDNRWVKLAKFISWKRFEPDSRKRLEKSGLGAAGQIGTGGPRSLDHKRALGHQH
jgi:hypothetical protein